MTKKGYKTTGHFKIPANLTPERRICFCIEIPDDPEHFAIFWGNFNRLGWRAMWGEPLTSDSEVVAQYWQGVNAKNRESFESALNMANNGCGCETPDLTRITADGIIEVSFDDGATWERIDEDVRFDGPIFPPLVGVPVGGVACAGAKSGREAFRLVRNRILSLGGSLEDIANVIAIILGALTVFLPLIGQVATLLLTALAILLITIGRAAFEAAITDATLEQFMCILFCHIRPDASFSESGWQAVKADVVQQMEGTVEGFYWNLTNTLGPAGLTNACRAFPGLAGSCDSCPCTCSTPVLGDSGTNLLSRPDIGVGWWQVTTTLFNSPGCEPNGCHVAAVEVPACCLHNAYQIVPPGINAAPGNRFSTDCAGGSGAANYGLNACVTGIVFRSFGEATFQFQILECPPPP